MVPYKTEGSFCLLVHDDIATSSAWHAKGSGSLALEGRFPGLQIRGSKLQSRSNRARKRDLSQRIYIIIIIPQFAFNTQDGVKRRA
jgi:hypothetical protein